MFIKDSEFLYRGTVVKVTTMEKWHLKKKKQENLWFIKNRHLQAGANLRATRIKPLNSPTGIWKATSYVLFLFVLSVKS